MILLIKLIKYNYRLETSYIVCSHKRYQFKH